MEVDSGKGRQKRATKTPKRFNETFDKPPKPGFNQIKQSPELWQTSKNIIKVKLTTKPRPYPPITKPASVPKTKEEPVNEPAESIDTEQSDDATIPKEVAKVEKTHKPKETKEKLPKETFKLKGPLKIKLKFNPKPDLKPPQPEPKRSRTPPVLADLIPNVAEIVQDEPTETEKIEDDNANGLIRCHCSVDEDLGLMVQCETCLTWQHGHCLGIDRPEDAPDGYTCRACSQQDRDQSKDL